MLFLLQEQILDKIAVDQVQVFAQQFVSYISAVYNDIYSLIGRTKDLMEEQRVQLRTIATEFSKLFIAPDKTEW